MEQAAVGPPTVLLGAREKKSHQSTAKLLPGPDQ